MTKPWPRPTHEDQDDPRSKPIAAAPGDRDLSMYRQILLAYDGSLEGRTALREGAMIARACKSEIFLLSVVPEVGGVQVAEGLHPGPMTHQTTTYRAVFDEGMARLAALGFAARGALAMGEPTRQVIAMAIQISADLVVIGHRRRTVLERWWSGSAGAFLVDNLGCSLLICRHAISDAAFEAYFKALEGQMAPAAEGRPKA